MNSITTLVFCGFLTAFTYAASTTKTECANVSGKEDFDIKKYFKGRWYLTNLEKAEDPTGVCQESKSEVLDDGTVKHTISSYYKVGTPEFVLIDCNSNTKDITHGKAILQCKVTPPTKIERFQLIGTVIETDYDSFAVFHACGKDGDKVTGENVLILSRDKDVEPSNPKIKETLKKLGLDLDTFISRKKTKCESKPDF